MSHYDEVPAVERLRSLIAVEADVKCIHALRELPGGRFAYLIETPFQTWPQFVVGTTDASNTDVKIHTKCSALWAAQDRFDEFFSAASPGPAPCVMLALMPWPVWLGVLALIGVGVWLMIRCALALEAWCAEREAEAEEQTWLRKGPAARTRWRD